MTRPAGGRLAAYHEGALVLDLVARHPQARDDFRERFAVLGAQLAAGLRTLGVPAGVGPVPGEYCPGEFSVNAAGTTKIVGTAQRLTRHGYLFSAVVLVTDPGPVRAVLVDAYAALGFDWRPASVGCVADHVPDVTVADVEDALLPGLHALLPGLTEDERVTSGVVTRHRPAASTDERVTGRPATAPTRLARRGVVRQVRSAGSRRARPCPRSWCACAPGPPGGSPSAGRAR